MNAVPQVLPTEFQALRSPPNSYDSTAPPDKVRVAVFGSLDGGFHILRQLLQEPLSDHVTVTGLATDDPNQPFTHPNVRLWRQSPGDHGYTYCASVNGPARLEFSGAEMKLELNDACLLEDWQWRLVPQPMTIRIPVGSYFGSANRSAHNMVTTSAASVRVLTDGWTSLSVDAACANRPRDIPGGSDTFRIQRSPEQAELARLMPVLEEAGAGFPTRQAAVWIVTDDADYNDLGMLVASAFGFGGSRTINEPETARAMKICWEAGIDIARKRIWRDRLRVWRNVHDPELKSWLAGQ